jgi:putative DNA primase/helicase
MQSNMTSTLNGAARVGQDAPSLKQLTEALKGKRTEVSNTVMARCPVHDDNEASLALRDIDGKIVFHCHAGCPQEAILSALRARGVWPKRGERAGEEIVAAYDYKDEQGQVLFQVIRCAPKSFWQRRPDGQCGWVWGVKGVRVVPYRLADVVEAVANGRQVLVVEGERDCDNLGRIGVVATCNAGGAGKWRAAHAAFLKGADVIVVPDNDAPGEEHACKVAESLQGIARRVRVLEFPTCRRGEIRRTGSQPAGLRSASFSLRRTRPTGNRQPAIALARKQGPSASATAITVDWRLTVLVRRCRS